MKMGIVVLGQARVDSYLVEWMLLLVLLLRLSRAGDLS